MKNPAQKKAGPSPSEAQRMFALPQFQKMVAEMRPAGQRYLAAKDGAAFMEFYLEVFDHYLRVTQDCFNRLPDHEREQVYYRVERLVRRILVLPGESLPGLNRRLQQARNWLAGEAALETILRNGLHEKLRKYFPIVNDPGLTLFLEAFLQVLDGLPQDIPRWGFPCFLDRHRLYQRIRKAVRAKASQGISRDKFSKFWDQMLFALLGGIPVKERMNRRNKSPSPPEGERHQDREG